MQHVKALLCILVFSTSGSAAVDTLRDTSDIHDCFVRSWQNCDGEVSGEDCRRYNTGGTYTLQCGQVGVLGDTRTLILVPGYNDSLPDSSQLQLFNYYSFDEVSRKIFLYPLTTLFFEGTESAQYGDYPDPDSGATWFHAWLDTGDVCSLSWSTAGGDYTTSISCTAFITVDSQYYSFNSFNRILTFWDTSAYDYGLILVNENAFPGQSSVKGFHSSEYITGNVPLLLLFYPDYYQLPPRRRRIIEIPGEN